MKMATMGCGFENCCSYVSQTRYLRDLEAYNCCARCLEQYHSSLSRLNNIPVPVFSWLQQVTVAGEGGLRTLVALSRCEDVELRILAAGALRHLSLNTRVKRPMVEEGALGSILRRDLHVLILSYPCFRTTRDTLGGVRRTMYERHHSGR